MTTNKITDKDILDLWDENEKTMGEQAAFCVACQMLGISESKAYEILLKKRK